MSLEEGNLANLETLLFELLCHAKKETWPISKLCGLNSNITRRKRHVSSQQCGFEVLCHSKKETLPIFKHCGLN